MNMARGKKGSSNPIWRLAFLIYCGLMLWLLFGQRLGTSSWSDNVNFEPLKTIRLYITLLQGSDGYLVRHAFINLAGNVIMFVPIGYLLPRIWRKFRSFFGVFIITVIFIVLVESLQFFTGLGSCDVDDLILNVPGAMIGYLLWKLTGRKAKN